MKERHPWVLELAVAFHWPSIVRRVSPPLLFLGMDLAVDVQVKPSFLLGIVEKIMSCLGRATTVLCIAMDSRRLVPVVLAKMFPSPSVYF
jgi:hypothetical protein